MPAVDTTGRCRNCAKSLAHKKQGAMFCDDACRMAYNRKPEAERYPIALSARSRLNRCETHGKEYIELFMVPFGYNDMDGAWAGECEVCKQESALQPRVRAIFEDRRAAYLQAVERRMEAQSKQIDKAVEERLTARLPKIREEIRQAFIEEQRVFLCHEVEAEMREQIMADLKAGKDIQISPKVADPVMEWARGVVVQRWPERSTNGTGK